MIQLEVRTPNCSFKLSISIFKQSKSNSLFAHISYIISLWKSFNRIALFRHYSHELVFHDQLNGLFLIWTSLSLLLVLEIFIQKYRYVLNRKYTIWINAPRCSWWGCISLVTKITAFIIAIRATRMTVIWVVL
jgi:hypothetical protein